MNPKKPYRYIQPFTKHQYLNRFIWWIDDQWHRREKTHSLLHQKLCDWIDRRLEL